MSGTDDDLRKAVKSASKVTMYSLGRGLGKRGDVWALNGGLPEGLGFSLSTVYVAWAILLVALYPICAWYARFKLRHRDWTWLSYL